MNRLVVILILFISGLCVFAQKQSGYKLPSEKIVKLFNAEAFPDNFISPTGEFMLQAFGSKFLTIADLAQSEIALAGLSVNPVENGRSRELYADSLIITNLKTGKDILVSDLPSNSKLQNFIWSPNGKYIAFTHRVKLGYELWILDVSKRKAFKITESFVNTVMPINPIVWVDGGEWLVFTSVIQGNSANPIRDNLPRSPFVKESSGKKSTPQAYSNLLKDEIDKDLFEYYATSQLIKISIKKEQYPIGIPSIFKEINMSPDFRFMMVKMIHKPFSYSVSYNNFPYKVEIWDNDGNLFRELFDIPLVKSIPKGLGAVRKGPRNINWRGDKPATLYWVRALDGGNPNKSSVVRDRLYLFDFPFDGKGSGSITFKNRFEYIKWGKNDFAICSELNWSTRTEFISSFNPDDDNVEKQLIFEYNIQDKYNHPGVFMTVKNLAGYKVLKFDDKEKSLYISGKGAAPDGNKPFVDIFDIKTLEKKRLWQSNNPYYESPIEFVDASKEMILTKRESKSDAPNYFSRNLKNGVVSQITSYPNPYTQLVTMRVELIKCRRNDGVQLSGMLYTPPGYTIGDGMLPVLVWAHPSYYISKDLAGQIDDSPNKFTEIGWNSPLFWVDRGYAVLDNFTIPIVYESNDSSSLYTSQIVSGAQAMVHCLDSLGIADINRIAIGGSGFGASVAVNLLAHTDLFAAGIARDGVYNSTLTPFGFYGEQRTFWEAKSIYMDMSPFNISDKIDKPLLLIHGNVSSNFESLQSKQMYTAVKGNGGKVRLVTLPLEDENYIAKESVLHMLWEIDNWLTRNLKQNKR